MRTSSRGVSAVGVLVVVAVLVWLPGAGPAVATAPPPPSSPTSSPRTAPAAAATVAVRPVPGPVVRGFDQPTRFGPGHRGVDLLAAPGTRVRAPAAGLVVFAGRVVDSSWVTVDDGRHRWTVGPLTTVAVRRGAVVLAGATVGTSARAHGVAALHLSARTDGRYVEPVLADRPWVSLVPVGADAAAPSVGAVRGHGAPVASPAGPVRRLR